MELLDATLYGNTVERWLVSLLVAAVTLGTLHLLRTVLLARLGALARRTAARWDDLIVEVLRGTKFLFLVVIAVFAGALVLTIPDRGRDLLTSVTVMALLIQGGLWASAAILFSLEGNKTERLRKDPAGVTTMNALGFVSKVIIWSVVALLVLDNLGVDVTALVAGLGVGGIAVALAVQNVLGDLFASLSIVFDKPFVLGDFLIIDEHLGSVEHIGLKTTRLRSLSGEQLIFSNTDLLSSRIRNYGRMFERRVVFTIGVTYETPREKLTKIPLIIRQAVEGQEKTRFDRSHFKNYGDFSLNFETVYYVLVREYNAYMDIQQAVNLRIHERFEEQGIEFAYPTQTLFVVKQES